MSQQRFIRCGHCGLPHEASSTHCSVTGKRLEAIKKKRPREPRPPPPDEGYSWEHSLQPWGEGGVTLDPERLPAFVGQLVEGKYRIEALIGRGGMGAVFRALNERIRKPVALKILYRGYAPGSDPERRFLREARVASSLGHRNIVEVFDLGHLDDGKPFQVMELLVGHSLAKRIQTQGALPEREALSIFEQVLSALDAAHERGVIHRDLKPENVFLVERKGATVAKLLDFGVSKLAEDHSLTVPGVVVGTPAYLSPEQARGDRDIDHRVDLWAMGVLMYECLTGWLPFDADDYGTLLRKILSSRPLPPSEHVPIDPCIEAVVLRALSASRDDRPGSAREMLDLIRQARGEPSAEPFAPANVGAHVDRGERPREALPSPEPGLDTQPMSFQQELDQVWRLEDPTEVTDGYLGDDRLRPRESPTQDE